MLSILIYKLFLFDRIKIIKKRKNYFSYSFFISLHSHIQLKFKFENKQISIEFNFPKRTSSKNPFLHPKYNPLIPLFMNVKYGLISGHEQTKTKEKRKEGEKKSARQISSRSKEPGR